jgi:M6 family metalloprotease-like protein
MLLCTCYAIEVSSPTQGCSPVFPSSFHKRITDINIWETCHAFPKLGCLLSLEVHDMFNRFAWLCVLFVGNLILVTAVSALNPPKGTKFPQEFLQALQRGDVTLDYGDPGWLGKMEARRNLRKEIALGKASAAQTLVQDKFILPVLLGRTTDTTNVYSVTDMQNQLFDSNPTGTMTQYYNEISYGQFELTGQVYGWFDAGKSMSNYSGTSNGLNEIFPQGHEGFVYDIVVQADPAVNFSLYDNDGPDGLPNSGDDDGYADAVAVVYAGEGPDVSSGNANNLWPVQSTLGSAEYTTNDASFNGGFIKVNTFFVVPERGKDDSDDHIVKKIGVYVHEFGHVLGLPDLYDTTDDDDSEGLGEWCLMASGSHGGDGQHGETPAHMSAWCKIRMGWLTPTVVSADGDISLPQVETTATVYKVWEDDFQGGQYFLLENRQQTGFDTYLNGTGLMVYHVDGLLAELGNNNDETHKLVDLEAADGNVDLDDNINRGDDGDPWPGSSGSTTFSDFTTPNARDYDGLATGISVTNISASGPTMTASVTVRDASGYTLAYDEDGYSGSGWGYDDGRDDWSGVLFTSAEAGTVEAVELAISADSAPYVVEVFQSFSNGTPSNALTMATGTLTGKGWHRITLPTGQASIAANQDFFVSIKFSNINYATRYDKTGAVFGRSYTSSDGTNWMALTNGDINIRAIVRTEAAGAAIQVSPWTLTFDTEPDTWTTDEFTVSNIGASAVTVVMPVVSGEYFSLLAPQEGFTLASGDSQEVTIQYRPEAEGTHAGTVTISADSGITETVVLTGTSKAPDLSEPNETRAAAYAVTLDTAGAYTGSYEISASDDVDWYAVSANVGDKLTITVDVTSELDAELVFYNPDETKAASMDTGYAGQNETITGYPIAASGTYYIGVGYWKSISKPATGSDSTGSYSLNILVESTLDASEPNNAQETATPLTLASDGTFSGDYEITTSNDLDFYSLTLNKGDTLTALVTPTSDLDAELVLHDASDATVAAADNSYGAETLTYVAQTAGSYYIGVGYYQSISKSAGQAATTGSYTLAVTVKPQAGSSEPNENRATATTLLLGTDGTVTGTYEIATFDDEDWYALPLTMGDKLTVMISGLTNELDAELVLYDASDSLVASADSGFGGETEGITGHEAAVTGMYYIGVGYYLTIKKPAGQSATTGSYTLSVIVQQSGGVNDGTVEPPAALNMVDHPGDSGGFVDMKFVASPNHPGASGDVDETFPIAGYWVFMSATSDSADAVLLGALDVGEITIGAGDTVRVTIGQADSLTTQWYWIQAVEETQKMVSDKIGPNRVRAIDNVRAAQGDLDGKGEVDIWDVAIVAEIFGIAEEYDPAIDLSGNGEVDIWDVAEIAEVFGQTVE